MSVDGLKQSPWVRTLKGATHGEAP
jgi:hypothetical protein